MMRFSSLQKLKMKTPSKIEEIEDFLDQEIEELLNKKMPGAKSKSSYNSRYRHDEYEEERYPSYYEEPNLPFDDEDIRPRRGYSSEKARYMKPRRYEEDEEDEFIENYVNLDSIRPVVEEWMEDHLDKMVRKLVKKHIAKRNQEELKLIHDERHHNMRQQQQLGYYNSQHQQQHHHHHNHQDYLYNNQGYHNVPDNYGYTQQRPNNRANNAPNYPDNRRNPNSPYNYNHLKRRR